MYKLTTFRGKNSQTDSFRCSFRETIKKAKKQFFSFIHSLPTVTFVEKPNIGNVTLLILGVKQLQLLRIYFYSQLTLPVGLPVGSTCNRKNYSKILFLRLRTDNLKIFILIVNSRKE
jgi:hypothetical protein